MMLRGTRVSFAGRTCLARWRLLEPDAGDVSELARVARVDLLCARVLANRGVLPEAASGFLSPSLKSVGAPKEEAWRVAARRISRAIEGGERIGVFGDYDTDGITSAATLYLALSRYTNNLLVKLPTRQAGYGLQEPYVRDLFAEGVDLIVTADCGISNKAEVELARSLGMDIIVTDHHIPPENPPEAPPAIAVLDPKLWDAQDPLAGVGVAWKLAWAVARELEDPDGRRHIGRLLDLVSLGTVVDIAPLVGDNRALASMGLKHINQTLAAGRARPGIEAIVKAAGVRGELTEEDLGWRLGPRINSIGRIKNPRPALELLLTDDRREALRIAYLLNQLNAERQRRTRYAVEEAMAAVDPEQDFKVVVTEEAGGLAGLIAGRVAGATGRPAAILNRRADGSYGGSARAGETDVDLYSTLFTVRHLMGEWGGHRNAAGLSVNPGNFDVFVAGGLRIEGSRQIWEGMNLLTLEGGIKAKMAGELLPAGAFEAAYTVCRSRYSGKAELEIVDWRQG